MSKKRYILLLLAGLPVILYGQGEIDDQETILFKDESTVAIHLNSNGFGANYRYARRQNAFKSTVYDIDFIKIKHPKEKKVTNIFFQNFVYGQMNALFGLRTGLGLQEEIFSKRDKGSISIRYFYTGGLSMGLIKPVYYIINDSLVRYDINTHLDILQVENKASFFKGIDQLKFVPGIHAKFGFCFEFGSDNTVINALEGGIGIDVFARPIEIMATHKSVAYFSFILSYRFGKVVSQQFRRSRGAIDKAVDF
ncbi:MAG: hypothetical protein GVY19_10975 [Bacteroidetes bacterium]|jgi:hypothetical protein|nr:hypothetical protein [Bacteroidota bacterium]